MKILYHYPLCAFSRIVRLAMAEKKIDFRLITIDILPSSREISTLSPAPEHPLLDDNNHRITGFYAVSEYLEETYPEISLLSGHAVERAEIRHQVAWFAGRFYEEVTHRLVGEKLLKRLMSPQQEPDSRKIHAAYQAIHHHMEMIGRLSEENTWLAGDNFSLADISAAAQLSCLDYGGDVPWDQYLNVKDWYARVKSRPSFRSILSDQVQGIPPIHHYAVLDF